MPKQNDPALCVVCGSTITKGAQWTIYADDAFKDKTQTPFPLHKKCFNQNERITVSEWRPVDPEDPESDLELVDFEIQRYATVDGPEEVRPRG